MSFCHSSIRVTTLIETVTKFKKLTIRVATLIEQKSEIQFETACFDNFVSFYHISIRVTTLTETVTKFKDVTIRVATLSEQKVKSNLKLHVLITL